MCPPQLCVTPGMTACGSAWSSAEGGPCRRFTTVRARTPGHRGSQPSSHPHRNAGPEGRAGALDLGPSPLLTSCVTLKEMLSFSGLYIPAYVGRGCGQLPFHQQCLLLTPHRVDPGRVSISPQTPLPALTPPISATGPLEERQIAYVCREALKVAGPIGLLTPPVPWSRAGSPAGQCVCWGVGWVECSGKGA